MELAGPQSDDWFVAVQSAGRLVVRNEDGCAWRLEPFQLAFECPSDGLDLLVLRVSAFAVSLAGILAVLTLSGIAPLPLFGFAILWAGASAIGMTWSRRYRRRFGRTVVDFESNTYVHQSRRLLPAADSLQNVRVRYPGSSDGTEDAERVWMSLVNRTGQEIRLARGARTELRELVTVFRTYGCPVDST